MSSSSLLLHAPPSSPSAVQDATGDVEDGTMDHEEHHYRADDGSKLGSCCPTAKVVEDNYPSLLNLHKQTFLASKVIQ